MLGQKRLLTWAGLWDQRGMAKRKKNAAAVAVRSESGVCPHSSPLPYQFPCSRKYLWAFVAGTVTVAMGPLVTTCKATGFQEPEEGVSADWRRNAPDEAGHESTTLAPCANPFSAARTIVVPRRILLMAFPFVDGNSVPPSAIMRLCRGIASPISRSPAPPASGISARDPLFRPGFKTYRRRG